MHRPALYATLVAVACFVAVAGVSYHSLSRDDEEQAIREIDTAWSIALQAKDLDTVMNSYAQDAVFLVPGQPLIAGKAMIRAWFEKRIATPGYSASFMPTRIVVAASKDIAYELGTFHVTYLDQQGAQMSRVGKHLVTWEKRNGRWRVTAESISSDS
ncbi:MAG TPA: SgcJ/EcaC family oxidoreductase [Mizugakiibacter sp.]